MHILISLRRLFGVTSVQMYIYFIQCERNRMMKWIVRLSSLHLPSRLMQLLASLDVVLMVSCVSVLQP